MKWAPISVPNHVQCKLMEHGSQVKEKNWKGSFYVQLSLGCVEPGNTAEFDCEHIPKNMMPHRSDSFKSKIVVTP